MVLTTWGKEILKGMEEERNNIKKSRAETQARIEKLKAQLLAKQQKEALESEEKEKPKKRKPSNLKRKTLKGKETQIMDAVSFAHKEGDRALITTNMNVSNGLTAGDKRTLRKSIQLAIKEKLGGGLYI